MSRELTNLECVALAQIWKMRSCTAHELRLSFATSTSRRYSGSAGAIYPLLRRLEASGYVKSSTGRNGQQNKRIYALRSKGLKAVVQWLGDLDPAVVSTDDPLRTRFQYLRLLKSAERADWFEAAAMALKAQDAAIRAEYEQAAYANDIDQAVCEGALEMNRLRQRWLSRMSKIFND